MTKADATEVARLLREYGQRTALRGGNPYRAKAFSRAADSLSALTIPLAQIIRGGQLQDIPGIGPAIAGVIEKMHRTGTHRSLEIMRAEMPASVLEMSRIPGLRAEKAMKIYKEIGIQSLEELDRAASSGQLRSIKGLGAALEAKILEGIGVMRQGRGQRHLHRAAELLRQLESNLLRTHKGIYRVQPAGDFRRGLELVGELAVVATVKRGEAPAAMTFADTKVWFADKASEGAALLMATGSDAHLTQLYERAAAKDLRLDAEGLWKGSKRIAGQDEASIYETLGLDYVPPELREGADEISLSAAGRLPDLVEDIDLKGILHALTDQSDGVNTLEQMVKATRARGYKYFGVADHSQSAHYAGGLTLAEIAQQHASIDQLNSASKMFHIFKGIEADILADGALDYNDDILKRFDFVVASVHSRFRLDRTAQTKRILKAVASPFTTILGHMTGRQLLRRPGYDVDVEAVLKACARHGVAVEINANPWRLDLDWRWHRRALEFGCVMSINPDAHSTSELDLTHWGVQMARKGGVPKGRVLNSLTISEIASHFAGRRAAANRRRRARKLTAA